MPQDTRSILSLDVGSKRVGVAIASMLARLPHPLVTLTSTGDELLNDLQTIIENKDAGQLVVGLPRGLNGQSTDQTREILRFAEQLKAHFDIPIDLQDEALTSAHAEKELKTRGKPYTKGDIDSLAATYILEDWLIEHKELIH